MPALAILCTLACGCVHEQVAWPPTGEDIRRINAGAPSHGGWLRVGYVDPLGAVAGYLIGGRRTFDPGDAR
jgi:hypothetical protein